MCECTWDKITRAMPYRDYEEAMRRFQQEGRMDPRLTQAKVACR